MKAPASGVLSIHIAGKPAQWIEGGLDARACKDRGKT